jgi:Leucine Rich repeat
LATNTASEYLNLGENAIGDDGSVAIAGALATNKTTLTCQSLESNEIGDVGMEALAQNSSWDTLDVGRNQFGIASWLHLLVPFMLIRD